MATICGATGTIFFFSFGDSITRRKQALLLTSSFLILCFIVSLSLFATLIYWIATGLYGAQGPYFLAWLIFSGMFIYIYIWIDIELFNFYFVFMFIIASSHIFFILFRNPFSRCCFFIDGLENVHSFIINELRLITIFAVYHLAFIETLCYQLFSYQCSNMSYD